MRTIVYRRNQEDHGTSLLEEFGDMVDTHRDRAQARVPVVKARLAALEAEEHDLRTLLARLEAASK